MKNNFNLLRLIASVLVVLAHSVALSGNEPMWADRVPLYHLRLTPGTLAVHIFFVISGYLITKSFQRHRSFPIFAWHRFLRIAPALLVAVAFSYFMWSRYLHYAGNPDQGVNGSLWTISWEVTCYIAVAVTGALGILEKRNFNLFFAMLWLIYFTNVNEHGPYHWSVEPMLMFFAMGAFIAINEDTISIRKSAAWAAVVLVILLTKPVDEAIMAVLMQLPSPLGGAIEPWRLRMIGYTLSMPFIIIFAALYIRKIPFFERDISYGVYVYAWPVQQFVVFEARKLHYDISSWVVFAIAMPVICVIAFGSAILIEEPALRLKDIWRRKSPTGRVSAHSSERSTVD